MVMRCDHRRTIIILLIVIILLAFLVDDSFAFGAGNIPSYAFLENKAFRHGDIEDVLSELAKKSGGGILGFGAKKFGGLDIKRVYFGNWLRDYSQAMDVLSLSKMSRQAIINLVMALGFLAHGYATGEFEVTEERLGVYLPVEHIDNPKGYNDGKDARAVHPSLRGPVDPRELQIDPRTGMKNYISNENGTWDTSAACIRRTLLKCIEVGRMAKAGDANSYEAYRLLGTALHTLEDLTAHSNWCELSLRRLGHSQVFCHVGDACLVDTPSGRAPPLITGVFGGADFIHSLLGEATDHISEASVTDLTKAISTARSGPGSDLSDDSLRSLLVQLPETGGNNLSRELDGLSDIRSRTAPGSGFDPAEMSPQELHSTLWKVLKFRDDVCKSIEKVIERIPGLSSLCEKISNAVTKFVFTILEPYLKPLMLSATGTLQTSSAAVINKQAQYEVFDNPYADDPTHSLLSKDHFDLILNEPAGNLAKIIVKHTVKSVVQAWGSTSVDPHQSITKILEALHHPYFVDGSSDVQREMGEYMRDWIGKLSSEDREYVLCALTKESVRNGRNKRRGYVGNHSHGGCSGHGSATFGPHMQAVMPGSPSIMGKLTNHIPGYSQTQGSTGGIDRDVNQGYQSAPPVGTGGMIMPETECPLSLADYGPGPGGFSLPEPMTNFTNADSRSQPVGFPPSFPCGGGPPPVRHESYSPPPGMDYQSGYNTNNNGSFPGLPTPHTNTWDTQNVDWNNRPNYPPVEQRPPPPVAWMAVGEQPPFPTQQHWDQQSHQQPPPPPPGGYSTHNQYGGGY